ncbi:MAG: hypothetical protein ACYS47_04745 [Planctomycetota bacterium]|jgi:hypothetical protein
MRGTVRILLCLVVLGLAGRAAGEERWRLKFESEPPRKILCPPHVPPGLDVYFGQQEYWYVLYRITNASKDVAIGNGNPVRDPRRKVTGPRMCLKIWITTDADRRLVRPFIGKKLPGVEGMEFETEKKSYPNWDRVGARATWGSSRSAPLPPFMGAGAAYIDGFFPVVHDYIAEKHGYKPKFNPHPRYQKGPNAALPTLADHFDINDPLKPGETRTGCAIFSDYPITEHTLFFDALNLLSVFAEERRSEATTAGFNKLREYKQLFPEGDFSNDADNLLSMASVSRGGTSDEDAIVQTVESIYQEMKKGFARLRGGAAYAKFTEAIKLLTQGAKEIQVFRIDEAIQTLETFRQKFPKSPHYIDADKLYTMAKQNHIEKARREAAEILAKHAPKSVPTAADRIYVMVKGLQDPVLAEGNWVYADEPVLVVSYHRRGDPAFRALQVLRKVEERWIPGAKRPLHKIARTRIGDY